MSNHSGNGGNGLGCLIMMGIFIMGLGAPLFIMALLTAHHKEEAAPKKPIEDSVAMSDNKVSSNEAPGG